MKTPRSVPQAVAVLRTAQKAEVLVQRATHHEPGVAPGYRCDVAYLSSTEFRALWRGMQRLDPVLAAMLGGEDIQAIRQTFGASLLLPLEDLRRYLEAGTDAEASTTDRTDTLARGGEPTTAGMGLCAPAPAPGGP